MYSGPIGDWVIDSLTHRYCYWQSATGNRYLFTRIASEDIANFKDCVLLLASEEGSHPRIHWIGEIADLSPMALRDMSEEEIAHLSIYVHLLAGNSDERQLVIYDLEREADKTACRLSA